MSDFRCAYCGQVLDLPGEPDADVAMRARHVAACDRHPLRPLVLELRRLRFENEQLRELLADSVAASPDRTLAN